MKSGYRKIVVFMKPSLERKKTLILLLRRNLPLWDQCDNVELKECPIIYTTAYPYNEA